MNAKNKTLLITGANRGIGLALVSAQSLEGAEVIRETLILPAA
jgi:NAD(P)-dependent dehydrogenase (short-subunit alcohol dehydrogenase family)